MRTSRRFMMLVVFVFSAAVAVAGFITLNHVREEATHQASLDIERRIKTFWRLLRDKGEQFSIRDNRLLAGDYVVNGNYELPDKVREIFGGTATIFMRDTRVSTNVPKADGSRAVGTKLVGPAYTAIFDYGVPYRGEVDILGKPYLAAYDPIRNTDGEIIGVLYVGVEKGVFLDHYNHLVLGFLTPIGFMAVVTIILYLMLMREGRHAELQQKHHLQFLQTLIDTLPTPVYYKDSRGRYLGCNAAFEQMFEVSRHELVGKTAYDVSPAEFAAVYEESDQRLRAAPAGEQQQFEATVPVSGGTKRQVIFYKARFSEEGGATYGIIGTLLDITERKQMENRLRASEHQMADIINFLPDATWVIDREGTVVAWNKACEELTGVVAGEMLGKGDYAYAIPFYGVRRPMLIDGALKGASLASQDYHLLEQESDVATAEAYAPFLRLGKGAYVWGTARRLFDEHGAVSGAIETVRDVTERRQAELRDHARADILEHIAKDASLGDVLAAIARDVEQERSDLFCSILLVNAQGTRLTHGAAPSLPDFYNSAVNGLKIKEGAGSCGTAAYLKQRVIVADIESHPYWKNFQPARDAGLRSCWSEPILSSRDELLGTFALYSRKVWEPGPEEVRLIVTAANYASIAIERMQTITALKESENKYRVLVQNANSIIMRLDPSGHITFFNEFAQQFFGYSEVEILGQHVIGTIVPVYESSGRNMAAMIADVCAQPEKYALNENENMRKNGERVFISWANKASYAADGRLEEILCIGQDVTERKRMQEMILQTEKMMTVGGLAAGMAHELNNPIGTIAQHAQNIVRRVSPGLPANLSAAIEARVSLSRLRDYLERRGILGMLEAINASCERAATIIANMLTFSRKSTRQLEPVSLAELVDKAIELARCDFDLKKQYDFREIQLIREFDPEMPLVPVVPLEIEQVLLNLLKNAAQALASNGGTGTPTITIRLNHDDQWALLEVQDNGPGIDTEHRTRIFEPFFTTKEVGIGTGLGLSIVYSIIVNKHQGSITVDSTPGQGTCFSIRLPLNVGE